jgi:hypothetical protein
VYDKFAESGKEEYRDCVRFELELKGRISKAVWAKCCDGSLTLNGLLQMVIEEYKRLGVAMPEETLSEDVTEIPGRETTPIENTKAWLAKQVAPAVARIVSEYGSFTALQCLFHKALDQAALSGIIKLWSINIDNYVYE